jgi:hypothetical protein
MANNLSVALERINKCKKEQSKELNLSFCGLTCIPEEILEFDWLETLIIGNTVIEGFDSSSYLISTLNDFSDSSSFVNLVLMKNLKSLECVTY